MPGKRTTTSGWIEAKWLRRQPLSAPASPSAWEGEWQSEGVMSVSVTHDAHGLRASGLDDWDSGDGHNHHAEFSGRFHAAGARASLKEGVCEVQFTLLDEFMLVEDETSCGDGNTSFRGIYRRKW